MAYLVCFLVCLFFVFDFFFFGFFSIALFVPFSELDGNRWVTVDCFCYYSLLICISLWWFVILFRRFFSFSSLFSFFVVSFSFFVVFLAREEDEESRIKEKTTPTHDFPICMRKNVILYHRVSVFHFAFTVSLDYHLMSKYPHASHFLCLSNVMSFHYPTTLHSINFIIIVLIVLSTFLVYATMLCCCSFPYHSFVFYHVIPHPSYFLA